jgi:ribonuclease J
MKIHIHRGQNQIGGNIIEIASETTKILFDIGLELDDEKNKVKPDVKGLFDTKGIDAVFVSHYHSDHLGLAYDINAHIPLYMGEASTKIIQVSDNYKAIKSISVTGHLKHKVPITIGDITVTPFLCDHSAFDSYMLMAECLGERILYTGDFRSNGRKPFDGLLKQLPQNVDTLICEGTTLSREDYVSETEKELEERVLEAIKSTTGPVFVLQSSMNIDRIVTMYRAAKRSNRIFLQDLYMSEITSVIGGHIPNPLDPGFKDVRSFITDKLDENSALYQSFNKYGAKKISKDQISRSSFVMCVRSSMTRYLTSLSKKMSYENGLLIYSFWSGYRVQPKMKAFLNQCEHLGLKVITMHTSGHADKDTIMKLIEWTKPKAILPVHTENAQWFSDQYSNEIMINQL